MAAATATSRTPAGKRAAKKTAKAVAARTQTREELVNDETLWDMLTIASNLGVKHQTVKSWRRDYRRVVRNPKAPHPKLLPAPDGPVVPGKPLWKAGTVRKWAMQTGRMEENGTPKKQKPPGRPPRSS